MDGRPAPLKKEDPEVGRGGGLGSWDHPSKWVVRCTLPETNSSHLKMDGWKTFSFPFGARRNLAGIMLVLGSVKD